MAGLDYRHASIDYRHAGADYSGSLDASVAAGVVAGSASVPPPGVNGDAGVAAGVVGGVAGVPVASVAAAAGANVAAVAGAGAVGSVTVEAAAVAAVSTVGGSGAVPAATASQTAEAAPDPATCTGMVNTPDLVRRVVLTTVDQVPPLAPGEHGYDELDKENRLARFYPTRARGVNVWIASGAVTTTQPTDESTITRWLHGGHEGPDDLTETEADLLSAAGYTIHVEAA